MVLDNDAQNDVRDQNASIQGDMIGHDDEDLALLQAGSGDVVLSTPKPPQRLEQFSVICIICNRMIGTGIFQTTTTVMQYTDGVGITMLFWFFGAVAAMAGILVYIEFGLTTPRYRFGNRKISVPRNGGELHYLKDIFKRPAFLSTCVFGVIFVLLGTSAMNALSFGIRVQEAAGHPTADNFTSRSIAIAAITFAVILHGIWRQAGLFLNNTFAMIKILMLLLIIITGFCSWGGAFHAQAAGEENPGVAASNFNVHNSFKDTARDSHGFAESFLAVLFAYGGFNQANYVLSEIDNPRKKYKWPAFSAVLGTCILYLLVNIAYFIVIPAETLHKHDADVALLFFKLTFGTLSGNSEQISKRIFATFLAISSLGNIIVLTYTAARVKQEIAKEGVLPFRRLIAQSIRVPSIPVGRLFSRSSKPVTEETPAGGLVLHWIISVVLILATASQVDANASYAILVSLFSYTIDAFFGLLLGLGLLFLRFSSARKWALKSKTNSFVSISAALVFTIANAFPVISAWVPPPETLNDTTTTSNDLETSAPVGSEYLWFATPTIGWGLIALSVAYWVGFYYLVPRIGSHKGKELKVHRRLFFQEEHGYPVQWHEQLNFSWVIIDSSDSGDGLYHGDNEEIEVRLKGKETV